MGAGDTCIVAIAVVGRIVDGIAGCACRQPIALSLCRAIARASALPAGRGGSPPVLRHVRYSVAEGVRDGLMLLRQRSLSG